MRVGASTGEGGLGEEELNTVIRTLRSDDMVDFLDVSWSDYYNFKFVAAMDQPVGYQLPSSQQITAATLDIPRFVIGRIRTLEEAEQILRDGVADIVHMHRAHRSEEHTSELQSLMRMSYDVFCLKETRQNNTMSTSTP